MVRIGGDTGERTWLTSLPKELAFLIPAAPDKLRYEYSLSNLKASGGNGLNAILVIRARGLNPAERFVINPTRLAEEIVACGGGVYDRQEGSKSQLRFSEDGKDAFRLEDVSYRCAFSNLGCPSSIRIRHWAPAHGNSGGASALASKTDPNRPQRKCVECGRKGHRKQCCCDEPGNCRIEVVWAHTHSLDAVPPPPKSGRKRPSMRTSAPQKKPRTAADAGCSAPQGCVCSKLGESVREGKRQLLAAQNQIRTLERTLSEIETGNVALDAELRSVANRTNNAALAIAAAPGPGPSRNVNMNNVNVRANAVSNANIRANTAPNANVKPNAVPNTNARLNVAANIHNGLSEDAQRARKIEELRTEMKSVLEDRNPRHHRAVVSQPPPSVPAAGRRVQPQPNPVGSAGHIPFAQTIHHHPRMNGATQPKRKGPGAGPGGNMGMNVNVRASPKVMNVVAAESAPRK